MIVMKTIRMTVIGLFLAAFVNLGWSVTPEQIGAYAGTMKETIYFDGGQTVVKANLLLNVNADESTTFTVNGIQYLTQTAVYNSKDGVAVISDPGPAPNQSTILTTFNFKGT